MTRNELTALEVLIGEFREFRQDDREWKKDMGERVRGLEVFVASEDAEDDVVTAQGISRRAYFAIAASVAGTLVSVVLWVANLVIA